MKRKRAFLPECIDVWGGIENYLSGNKDRLYQGKSVPLWYWESHIQRICSLLSARLARSGKFPVDAANKLLWKACLRYSGAPSRSFESAKLNGMGVVVLDRWGHASASFSCDEAKSQWNDGVSSIRPYSDIETRRVPLWDRWEAEARSAKAEGIDFVNIEAWCRFCGTRIEMSRLRRTHDGYFCRRPECRHMAWLSDQPQSRGGIDLTPTQKRTTARELWDQVRVLNYLNAKAKQAGKKHHV